MVIVVIDCYWSKSLYSIVETAVSYVRLLKADFLGQNGRLIDSILDVNRSSIVPTVEGIGRVTLRMYIKILSFHLPWSHSVKFFLLLAHWNLFFLLARWNLCVFHWFARRNLITLSYV